ncbi:MobF family relaxase [Roseibium aggregatum]|uniref:Multifunctional conjugation protein TraI n=1 Tax=Roseibium aggregatum TaxID=187304 RepID=A0A0M6YB39_9HYPH|nr:MobF family relaxase [Roseibium aggregatum]CTQ47292.1 Multifunctional conjugation protein TraI [Roseibium aggregatum]
MFGVVTVKSIEYYEQAGDIVQAEAGEKVVALDTMDAVDKAMEDGRRRKGREKKAKIGRPKKDKNDLSYYGKTDNERGESQGVGIVLIDEDTAKSDSFFDDGVNALIVDGKTINTKTMISLADNKDPRTGDAISTTRGKSKDKDGSDKATVVALDLTFSAPKSYSIGWGLDDAEKHLGDGDGSLAADVEQSHQEAWRDAVKWAHRNGLFITRISDPNAQDKNKMREVHAGEVGGAAYGHKTSRAGDMQVHDHVVLLNMCKGADGKIRTIDNRQLMRYQKTMSAIYHTSLVNRLRDRTGLEAVPVDNHVELAGITNDQIKLWSKRREQMLEKANETGTNLKSDKAAADALALSTRGKKENIAPISELRKTWRQEAHDIGLTHETLMQNMRDASLEVQAERKKNPVTVEKLSTDAIAHWEEAKAVFEEQELAAQFFGSAQAAAIQLDELDNGWTNLKYDSRLIRLAVDRNNDYKLTTPKTVALEKDLIRKARDLSGRKKRIIPKAVTEEYIAKHQTATGEKAALVLETIERIVQATGFEAAYSSDERGVLRTFHEDLSKKGSFHRTDLDTALAVLKEVVIQDSAAQTEIGPLINQFIQQTDDCRLASKEQASAARYALGERGLALISGAAGSGKTTTTRIVVEALEASGITVEGVSGSWRATDVLRIDAQLAEENARALTGFINAVERGDKVPDENTVILVDEAAMVGLEQTHKLVSIAHQYGCRLELFGDARQLQPVAAGAPFKALEKTLGAAYITEIRRQKSAWQRDCSMLFSKGKTEEKLAAIREYDDRGHFRWLQGDEEVLNQLTGDYVGDLINNPKHKGLVLASTNADVRKLNNRIRNRLRDEGLIASIDSEIEIKCIVRGTDTPTMMVPFAQGDRVILGETLELDGIRYANGQIGTILAAWKDQTGEAYFDIQFDDGKRRLFSETDFIRHRELYTKQAESRGEKVEPLLPKLQHAFATTVYSSQGMTVDKTYIYDTTHAYVAMTRHREDVTVYVNTAQVHDVIRAKKGAVVQVDSDNVMMPENDGTGIQERNIQEGAAPAGGEAPKKQSKKTKALPGIPGEEEDIAVYMDEIKKFVFQRMNSSGAKENVCDFFEDIDTFLETDFDKYDIRKEFLKPKPEEKSVKQMVLEAFTERATSKTPRTVPSVGKKPITPEIEITPIQDNVQQSEESTVSATENKTPTKATNRNWRGSENKKISKGEFVKFSKIDLLAFATNTLGGSLIEDAGGADYEMVDIGGNRYLIYDNGEDPDGFSCIDTGESGVIWDLVADTVTTVESVPEAWHWLRKHENTQPEPGSLASSSPRVVRPAWEKYEDDWKKSFTEGKQPKYGKTREQNIAEANAVWQKGTLPQGSISQWLTDRGIDPETQAHFSRDIRIPRKGVDDKAKVLFKLYNAASQLVGTFAKGPKYWAKRKGKQKFESYAHASPSSGGAAGFMGNLSKPSVIICSEAHIDAMSYWQELGRPKDALIICSTGQVTRRSKAAAYGYAANMPDVPIHIATDADARGEMFYNDFLQAINVGRERAREKGKLTGPGGDIVDARPEPIYKDWNNKINGITVDDPWVPKTPIEKAQDETIKAGQKTGAANTSLRRRRPGFSPASRCDGDGPSMKI